MTLSGHGNQAAKVREHGSVLGWPVEATNVGSDVSERKSRASFQRIIIVWLELDLAKTCAALNPNPIEYCEQFRIIDLSATSHPLGSRALQHLSDQCAFRSAG